MSKNKRLRELLGWFSAVAAVGCLIATLYTLATVKIIGGIPPLPFNEVTSKSIDTRLDLSQTFFQLALLMMGALGALLIAKKDEITLVFAEKSEVVMFISASAVLLLSAATYGFYVNKISSQLADAAAASLTSANDPPLIPDIFDQNVNYLFKLQVISLILGTINSVLTLVSTHRLRN